MIFEASNGQEFCQKLSKEMQPDMILLDLSMPVMDGVETAAWIRDNCPEIKIIVISMHQDEGKVLELVRNGIKGYLLKDAEPDEFKKALDAVAKDDIYFPPFVTRHLIGSFSKGQAKAMLSDRELQFMKLAASELTYKEIADLMAVNARTVDSYREQLFAKLNIKNRVGLVLYGIKNKLIEI